MRHRDRVSTDQFQCYEDAFDDLNNALKLTAIYVKLLKKSDQKERHLDNDLTFILLKCSFNFGHVLKCHTI